LALIAKNGDFESPLYIFSPIGKGNMSEGLYQLSVEEQRQRVVDTVRVGVEVLFFAEDSISLSIYDLV
jgi:hypothetical protein